MINKNPIFQLYLACINFCTAYTENSLLTNEIQYREILDYNYEIIALDKKVSDEQYIKALTRLVERVKAITNNMQLDEVLHMSVFTVGDICKEVQRIQFDLEVKGNVESAIDRCKNLDELLCKIEEGEHELVIE